MWWIVIAMLLISTPVGAFDDWDRTDYALLGTSTALMVVDWRQTHQIAAHPRKFHEINPIIGRHPSHADVDIYFATSWLVKAGIAHVLPSAYRKAWLGAITGGSLAMVIHNNSIGLGVRW